MLEHRWQKIGTQKPPQPGPAPPLAQPTSPVAQPPADASGCSVVCGSARPRTGGPETRKQILEGPNRDEEAGVWGCGGRTRKPACEHRGRKMLSGWPKTEART